MAEDFGVLLQAPNSVATRRTQVSRANMAGNVLLNGPGVKSGLRATIVAKVASFSCKFVDLCQFVVLRNGGALVSTVGWSLVLHAGEVCWTPYQPRQNTNANYDEELALAA